jgi:hypothetical protein
MREAGFDSHEIILTARIEIAAAKMKRAATGLPKHSFCYPADALFDIPWESSLGCFIKQSREREVQENRRDKRRLKR